MIANSGTLEAEMETRDGIILLVEDNPGDEALVLRALKKHDIRNEVVTARTGPEALDYLFGTGPHKDRDLTVMPEVVLLDLKLPKLDGLEVLYRLRREERTSLLPVVIFTSSNEMHDQVNSYALGANSYVCKPVDFVQFSEVVRQIVIYWLVVNQTVPIRTEPSWSEEKPLGESPRQGTGDVFPALSLVLWEK
jgi:two-component system, response regulator